jgi:hypothetical protein
MSANEYNTTHVGLTPGQVVEWLDSWGDMPIVRNYLATGAPQWGVIAHVQQTADIADDFLLYLPHDAEGNFDPRNLRITLVTGNPVVESVKKAPYVSPDDIGFWDTFQNQLKDALGDAADLLKWVAIGAVALVALQVLRK